LEKIRRNDQFYVYAKAGINAADYQVLSAFYLPLIGPQAYALFAFLCNLMNRQNLMSEHYLHSDLESFLNTKLTALEGARFQLEAIGLLNVYFFNDCFAYEIKTPMSPSAFINDGILGQYLQAAVTEERFKKLVNLFKLSKNDKTGFINVTKSFEDVFPSISLENFESIGGLMEIAKIKPINIRKTDFDFRLFTESIPEPFLDKKQLTEEAKMKIVNLSYVYELDEMTMKDIYLKATNAQLELDLGKLSRYARDSYKLKVQKENESTVTSEIPTEESKEKPKDPTTYFKTVSPRTVLSDMSGGLVSAADLRIVERLIDELKMDKGVVNVLIAYTIKIKEGVMPPYDYFEKVGMNWKRNQVETVENAMDYVKHLNSEYVKNQSGDQKRNYGKNRKDDKPEVKIDWLESYIQSQK
jgi:replication initiation and membrane attachment protein